MQQRCNPFPGALEGPPEENGAMKKLIAHLTDYFAAAAYAEAGEYDMTMRILEDARPGKRTADEKRKQPLVRRTVLRLR
jgi:hypothetical protein